MTARKMNSIRLTIVVSCLAALLGICLPKVFLPVAGAEATLLSASPSSPQSEDIEELLQQLEAVKEQLDSSGPTDELMELYQKLLDQINDLTDQGMGLQRRMDKSKEITDDSSGSGSVSNKKKKRKARDNSDDSFQIFSGPSSLCISGSLAAGDPTYNRVRTQTTGSGVQSPCSLLPSANNVRYDAYEFEITDCTTFPTNVTITLCGPAGCAAPQALDTVLYVYRTGGLSGAGGAAHPFNPGDPCNNVVAAEDDLTGEHPLHLVGLHPRPSKRGLDGVGSELRRVLPRELAGELDERCAGVPGDDDGHASTVRRGAAKRRVT